MKGTIIFVSNETKLENLNNSVLKAVETYSGKCAGICYMKDEYFGTRNGNYEK